MLANWDRTNVGERARPVQMFADRYFSAQGGMGISFVKVRHARPLDPRMLDTQRHRRRRIDGCLRRSVAKRYGAIDVKWGECSLCQWRRDLRAGGAGGSGAVSTMR